MNMTTILVVVAAFFGVIAMNWKLKMMTKRLEAKIAEYRVAHRRISTDHPTA